MNKTVLLQFSGPDQPGLIAVLTGILADANACVLDIGQSVIHETVVLGLLVETAADKLEELERTLQETSADLDLRLTVNAISPEELEHWIAGQGKDRFIITMLGRAISARQLARVSAIIAEHGLNVSRIERLSGRRSLAVHTPTSNACVELRVRGHAAVETSMRSAFLAAATELRIDIAFQRESIFRRNRRLFAFDMDSTLIQGEVIDELARMAGVGDKVVAITESAMRGEIEFQESFRRRVALLRGLPEAKVLELLGSIPLVDGAEQLIGTLKKLGYKTAILSGGFTFFARHLQQRLGIDYVYANELDIVDGAVTGEVTTEIVDGARKAALLREIARRENISLEQVVAVGDGANDLPMLGIAGMGIAFRAKPIVRQTAGHAVSFLGLDSLLYLIGVRERDRALE
ncbi:MAG: phosphoserine phosphatase SerB [Edaphobacter sp.]|uniref:phosphoserine phosphatase SerB n=1 Tax=Edaphobacter sp. TaxID=1934404 RepID=UPI002382C80C|nr:phosphoserine phosphatase SerB [Edaphobacter sp.]MDE1177912.1 phosphoserine phosphatase SerB [Edaphobacter sp.]